jgi:hypothetical protein
MFITQRTTLVSSLVKIFFTAVLLLPAISNAESSNAYFDLYDLLEDPVGNEAEIREKNSELTDLQRGQLLHEFETPTGLPAFFNGVIGLGSGSLIQGDALGAVIGFVGEGAGALLFITNFPGHKAIGGGAAIGIALFGVTRIFQVTRAFLYAKKQNRALNRGLLSYSAPDVHLVPVAILDENQHSVPGLGLAYHW